LVIRIPGDHDDDGVLRFLAELAEAGLKPVLTVRLEDERQRYFALNVKGVPVADIAAFLARCPRMTALCTGLAVGEALQLAEAADNFLADLAYMENIELAALLRPRLPPRRLLFGTLTPMLSAQAQTAKLAHPGFSATERRVVGFGNATRLLNYIVDHDKTYLATIRLGQRTTTDDADGELPRRPDRCQVRAVQRLGHCVGRTAQFLTVG